MVLDESTNTYNPDKNFQAKNFQVEDFWCGVNCTVVAMVIAASDGPAPLMDILAISYQVSCLAQC